METSESVKHAVSEEFLRRLWVLMGGLSEGAETGDCYQYLARTLHYEGLWETQDLNEHIGDKCEGGDRCPDVMEIHEESTSGEKN